jgi:hypothetical protein
MLNKSELFKVSQILTDGHYGSFMSAIGCALQLADSVNSKRLYEAFGDKFEAIYANLVKSQEIEVGNRQLSEDEIQTIVEDRIVCLHDKLMQGQITKIEYDKEVSIVDKWAIQQAGA